MQLQQLKRQLHKTDPYDILGVEYDDNQNAIKQSFKKLALKYHPDKNKLPGAKQAFHNITNAYDVLTKMRSYSAPPKRPEATTSKPTYHKQSSFEKPNTHYQNYEKSDQFYRFRKQETQRAEQARFRREEQSQFAQKMFDVFKNITINLKKQSEKRKESKRQEQNYQRRRYQANEDNRRRGQPPPILLLLVLVFLGLFFFKFRSGPNSSSGIGLAFKSSRPLSSFGMGRMGRIGRIGMPMIVQRSNNRVPSNQDFNEEYQQFEVQKQNRQQQVNDNIQFNHENQKQILPNTKTLSKQNKNTKNTKNSKNNQNKKSKTKNSENKK